jgi:transcriptional regulator with XRE-family HTH domain
MATVVPQAYHDKIFANRLQIFREQYISKSQNQASKMLGVSQSALSYMESMKAPIKFEIIAKLVKDFHLNQDWFATGNGKPVEKNPTKSNLITDINSLNEELNLLKKYIKIMEINQNYLIKRIDALEKKTDSK